MLNQRVLDAVRVLGCRRPGPPEPLTGPCVELLALLQPERRSGDLRSAAGAEERGGGRQQQAGGAAQREDAGVQGQRREVRQSRLGKLLLQRKSGIYGV